MAINVEELKKQLTTAETEFEQVKAHLYRLDGVVQTLKGLIAVAEKPVIADDAPKDV